MIKTLGIDQIIVPQGRRAARDVEGLAASIETIGLLNPITVTESLRLIAGGNRLEAFRFFGRTKISANILSLNDLDAELAEIDENLIRNELTVLERSEQLLRRKEIYEAKFPETKHVSERGGPGRGHKKTDDIMSSVSFASDAASKTGMACRTIQREVRIAKNIAPEVKESIRNTDLADHKVELSKLASLPESEQKEVARKITSGEAKSVSQAQRLITPPTEPEPWSAFDGMERLREAIFKIMERWPKDKLNVLGARLVIMGQEILEHGEIH